MNSMTFCSFCYIFSKVFYFFFSSRRRHTRFDCDWSSDVCSSDLIDAVEPREADCLEHVAGTRRDGRAKAKKGIGAVGERGRDFAGNRENLPPFLKEIGRASCRERV